MSDRKWEPEPYAGPDSWARQNGLAGQRVVRYQDEWIAYDGYSSWSYWDDKLKALHLVNYWAGRGCSFCSAPNFNGRQCRLRGWVSDHGVGTEYDRPLKESGERVLGTLERASCKCGWKGNWVPVMPDGRVMKAHRLAWDGQLAHLREVGGKSQGHYDPEIAKQRQKVAES